MAEDLRDIRLKKLELLREAGLAPYAARFPRTHGLEEALAGVEDLEGEARAEEEVAVAGRVLTMRTFGRLTFLHLLDGSGRGQVAIDEREVGREALELLEAVVDLGDFIGVHGHVGRTKKGEPTVWATSWTFLAKALRPLPEKWKGLQDVETRQRERMLDLVANEATRERFRFRTRFVRTLRRFLDDHGFEEVDTPVLQTKVSGALARPFRTHHNALDMEVVLRIAPETWLKQLVGGGYDRVYEVARCFRNEGMDPSHLQDFTMVEWYAAWWDHRDNMAFTERLVVHLLDELLGRRQITFGENQIDFEPPWPRVDLLDLVERDTGIAYAEHEDGPALARAITERGIDLGRDDLDRLGRATLFDQLYKKVSRPRLVDPVFVTGHPLDLSPLARRNDVDPSRTDRYQLVVNGWEVINAYSELVDPVDQRRRFERQAEARAAGDEEALEVDEAYLRAMEHGFPPMSGWGMGVDRFVALLTGQENLREVVLFPLMRPPGTGGEEAQASDEAAPDAASSDAEPSDAASSDPAAAAETMDGRWRDLLGHPVDDIDDLGIDAKRARELFDAWVETPSLRRQMEQAAVVMAALARELGGNEEAWRLLGLLHNLDYDRVKEPERHCLVAAETLRDEGVHPGGIHAIAAHNDEGLAATGIRCVSRLDHAVSCAEAVVGLVHAASQVLPSKDVRDLKAKSLRKRFRSAKFAEGVDRDLIARCEGLGLEVDAFLALALEALQAAAGD